MALVATLFGEQIQSGLCEAYASLASDFLKARGLPLLDASAPSTEIDEEISKTEDEIELTRESGSKVEMARARPIELFNNLRHIFVIIHAGGSLAQRGLRSLACAPTQQSSSGGDRVADLQGDGWVLEAYGGVSAKNNRKLVKALESLQRGLAKGGRAFLALRESATKSAAQQAVGDPWVYAQRRYKTKGGRVPVEAKGVVFGLQSGVVVIEVTFIDVPGE